MDQTAAPFLRQFLGKYKYCFLILLVGIILMLLPVQKQDAAPAASEAAEASPKTESLQEQLTELLSQEEGAGRVRVLLTQATGERIQYQTNDDLSSAEHTQTSRTDTVILTDSSRNQIGLVAQIDPPTYLGAVVLCQGAENSAVKLAITQAVSNATGLGYHKITVLKMK